ncbi:MAG: hypothetical protein ACJ8F7_21020 [Gemmataceae bacterium]
MSDAVQEILQRIEQLPEDDRLEFEEHFAKSAEQEWRREAAGARRLAQQKGIDHSTIDAAVEQIRRPIDPQ